MEKPQGRHVMKKTNLLTIILSVVGSYCIIGLFLWYLYARGLPDYYTDASRLYNCLVEMRFPLWGYVIGLFCAGFALFKTRTLPTKGNLRVGLIITALIPLFFSALWFLLIAFLVLCFPRI